MPAADLTFALPVERPNPRRGATLLAFLAAALTLGNTLSHAQDEDAKLAAVFRGYLDETFRMQPLEGTRLGDHHHDAELEVPTVEARTRWVARERTMLTDLPRQVNYQKLSRDGQIDFETFQHSLTSDIWMSENLHPFEQDPRIYEDYISDSIYLLLTQSSLPAGTNVANCLARMKVIPEILATARQTLHNPIRTHTETAIRQNKGAIEFYSGGLMDYAGDTPLNSELKAAGAQVAAALREYQDFLEKELLPTAGGEWRLGRERFSKKMELDLDAGLTADQVFADAKTEFDRVERDMYVIARQLWSKYFPKAALPPDDAAGRRETVARVLGAIGKEHCKPEEITAQMKQCVARLKAFITANDILRLPEPDHCQVVEMPEFKRGNSTAYMEAPPPLDPTATGHLAVSPPPHDWPPERINSYLEEYNNRMMQILGLHEGYPGHSVQLEYMNRNGSLIRKVLQSGVYIEGWAVYTEQMMVDQGYGDGDLALRLTQLKFYLRAVANALLDHQMHCDNLSDDEALKFLMGRCFQSEGEAKLKVIRAKQSSCQLSTYFVGRMAHYRLHQQIEREMGERFVLGRYHEAVLEPGAVSVKYLPELVRRNLGL